MTADNILVLFILAMAIVLFVSENLRADVVALLVMLTLSPADCRRLRKPFKDLPARP